MTAVDDRYYTIKTPSRYEIKVKGSRFLAESECAVSVEEAQAALERTRKREHDATHHCYAYRIGLFDRMIFKYSDDGEPSGTAGRPIYDVICGHDLIDIIVIVTRYFGGTKLGPGGLARAYSEAARGAIERSGRQESFVTESIRLGIEFPLYDRLMKILPRFDATQAKADFSDRVIIELEVRKSKADELVAEVVRLTGGKADIERSESR